MNADQRAFDPGSSDHAAFDELAVGWALHALEPEDEAVFAAHLPGCARCAGTVAETTGVMEAMAGELPPAEPSEGLRARLRSAVDATEQLPGAVVPRPAAGARAPGPRPAPLPEPVPRRMPSPRRRPLVPALAAAAVAAVVGLGLWNLDLSSDRRQLEAVVAEQDRVVAELLQPGRATVAPLGEDGRPVATVVARDDRVQVVTHGLAVNDAESSTYVVWGLGGDRPFALGTFDVEQSQIDVRTVGSGQTGLDDFAQYGVSLEPGREAPSAPTDVVATGQVTS
jgi:hypothetical protein